jgi:hypothetical protein
MDCSDPLHLSPVPSPVGGGVTGCGLQTSFFFTFIVLFTFAHHQKESERNLERSQTLRAT